MSRKPRRLSIRDGNTVVLVGTLLASAAAYAPSFTGVIAGSTLLVLSWVGLWYFPHCLTHYVAGRLLGIRFSHYVIGRSGLAKLSIPALTKAMSIAPVLGLRLRREGPATASRRRMAVMFIGGAAASMTLPIIPFIYSLYISPLPVSILLAIISLANIGVTFYYSPKTGDLWRAKKALMGRPA